jgi:hypothetical protein
LFRSQVNDSYLLFYLHHLRQVVEMRKRFLNKELFFSFTRSMIFILRKTCYSAWFIQSVDFLYVPLYVSNMIHNAAQHSDINYKSIHNLVSRKIVSRSFLISTFFISTFFISTIRYIWNKIFFKMLFLRCNNHKKIIMNLNKVVS